MLTKLRRNQTFKNAASKLIEKNIAGNLAADTMLNGLQWNCL
jgi:hypothetical protein